MPSLSEVRAVYRKTALNVENIKNAVVEITAIDKETRTLRGIITATTANGQAVAVEI